MASNAQSIWAIDVGNNSLKALHLRTNGDAVEVTGFDTIEHDVILTAPGVNEGKREEMIASSLQKFAERHNLGGEKVSISVSGQSGLARFIKLPPVEPKRIPQIIQFEAVQQIPFDINEVEWDWQLMEDPDSPDASVGIFAIKNEIVLRVLEQYREQGMVVQDVQMSPMALYNYLHFDTKEFAKIGNKASIIIDMGTDTTNIVICTRNTVWHRCINMGGNDFTKAIASAFKLDFAKAEKLKRNAPMNKYARQIFQAMKPVFSNFSEEVQRSIGFYSSTNSAQFANIIAVGGGMKLQGLSKYVGQTLNLPIIRPDSFTRISIASEVSSAKFHENIADFGVVYGLSIQGLGLSKIQSNLLPKKIARAMAWNQKAKYFNIAAGIFLVACIVAFGKATIDGSSYKNNQTLRTQYKGVMAKATEAIDKLEEQEALDKPLNQSIQDAIELFEYRDTLPKVYEALKSCLPNAGNTPEQAELYKAYSEGDINAVMEISRKDRKQLFISGFKIDFANDVSVASFDSSSSSGRGGGRSPDRSAAVRAPVRRKVVDPRAARGSARPEPVVAPVAAKETVEATSKAGFVIVVEGYSPYENISELLDPSGVSGDESKWGFVTRLVNIKKYYPKASFSLYEKDVLEHFDMETGLVDLNDPSMPEGMGVLKTITRVETDRNAIGGVRQVPDNARGRGATAGNAPSKVAEETVIIDPLTSEEVSRTYVIDENGNTQFDAFNNVKYNDHDHWFRIKFKIIWDNAPGQKETTATNVESEE